MYVYRCGIEVYRRDLFVREWRHTVTRFARAGHASLYTVDGEKKKRREKNVSRNLSTSRFDGGADSDAGEYDRYGFFIVHRILRTFTVKRFGVPPTERFTRIRAVSNRQK